jgi:hypothetical protein
MYEGIDLLAAYAPDLRQTLTAAKQAGLSHVNLDGVAIRTDRVKTPAADVLRVPVKKIRGGN